MLAIENLSVTLPVNGRMVPVVENVNLSVQRGQILGVAGESGSGKTMSSLAVLQLLPKGAEVTGSITLDGKSLLELSERQMRRVRGREVAMVFQDPMSSLHPMLTVGHQLTDHLRRHLRVSRKVARVRAAELLAQVRLPDPQRALSTYPHQLSGGMRQRVAIAVALACDPKILIADEPTTALDVTVQAGILELLDTLRRETGIGVVVITHDLGVLSSIADELAVFYAGRVVEQASARDVFTDPRHPYAQALLAAIPHDTTGNGDLELRPMRGYPPAVGEWPNGCSFHPRCDRAIAGCDESVPVLLQIGRSHQVACFAEEIVKS